jgi:hypothetical protein
MNTSEAKGLSRDKTIGKQKPEEHGNTTDNHRGTSEEARSDTGAAGTGTDDTADSGEPIPSSWEARESNQGRARRTALWDLIDHAEATKTAASRAVANAQAVIQKAKEILLQEARL